MWLFTTNTILCVCVLKPQRKPAISLIPSPCTPYTDLLKNRNRADDPVYYDKQ